MLSPLRPCWGPQRRMRALPSAAHQIEATTGQLQNVIFFAKAQSCTFVSLDMHALRAVAYMEQSCRYTLRTHDGR